jgi:hypothetical protein
VQRSDPAKTNHIDTRILILSSLSYTVIGMFASAELAVTRAYQMSWLLQDRPSPIRLSIVPLGRIEICLLFGLFAAVGLQGLCSGTDAFGLRPLHALYPAKWPAIDRASAKSSSYNRKISWIRRNTRTKSREFFKDRVRCGDHERAMGPVVVLHKRMILWTRSFTLPNDPGESPVA